MCSPASSLQYKEHREDTKAPPSPGWQCDHASLGRNLSEYPSCLPSFVLPSPLHSTMLLAGLAAGPLLPACRIAFGKSWLSVPVPFPQADCSGFFRRWTACLGTCLSTVKDSSELALSIYTLTYSQLSFLCFLPSIPCVPLSPLFLFRTQYTSVPLLHSQTTLYWIRSFFFFLL